MDEEDFDESLISAAKIQALHFNPTQPNILFVGLVFAGFDSKRQRKVGLKRNTRRFLSFYGVEPLTIKALFADLRSSYPKLLFVNLMMTINWFKLYDSEPVLEGRWGFCAEYIGPKLKETSEMIQSLVKKKIKFEYDPEDVLIMTLDTVNYLIQEPRTTPSTCYFDPKSKSAGAVSLSMLNLIHSLHALTPIFYCWYRNTSMGFHSLNRSRSGCEDLNQQPWMISPSFEEAKLKKAKILGTSPRYTPNFLLEKE